MISLLGYYNVASVLDRLRPVAAEVAREVAEEQMDSPPVRYVKELEHEVLEFLQNGLCDGEVETVREWDEEGRADAAEQSWATRTGR